MWVPEERKQHPGARGWQISPYSCLVSGSSWEEGWLGATTGRLLLRVLWVCLYEDGAAVWGRDRAG